MATGARHKKATRKGQYVARASQAALAATAEQELSAPALAWLRSMNEATGIPAAVFQELNEKNYLRCAGRSWRLTDKARALLFVA